MIYVIFNDTRERKKENRENCAVHVPGFILKIPTNPKKKGIIKKKKNEKRKTGETRKKPKRAEKTRK